MEQFTDTLLAKFTEQITDQVFLFVENDRALMSKYLHLVAREGDLRKVNNTIAKEIKAHFNLTSLTEEQNPKSKLIQSHTMFEK